MEPGGTSSKGTRKCGGARPARVGGKQSRDENHTPAGGNVEGDLIPNQSPSASRIAQRQGALMQDWSY